MKITRKMLQQLIKEELDDQIEYSDYDMMLSELVEIAQKALRKHGDMPVQVDGPHGSTEVGHAGALDGSRAGDPNYSLPDDAPDQIFFLISPDV